MEFWCTRRVEGRGDLPHPQVSGKLSSHFVEKLSRRLHRWLFINEPDFHRMTNPVQEKGKGWTTNSAVLIGEPSIQKMVKDGGIWVGHISSMPENNPSTLEFVTDPVGTRRRNAQREMGEPGRTIWRALCVIEDAERHKLNVLSYCNVGQTNVCVCVCMYLRLNLRANSPTPF